jgi:hypothetical protein
VSATAGGSRHQGRRWRVRGGAAPHPRPQHQRKRFTGSSGMGAGGGGGHCTHHGALKTPTNSPACTHPSPACPDPLANTPPPRTPTHRPTRTPHSPQSPTPTYPPWRARAADPGRETWRWVAPTHPLCQTYHRLFDARVRARGNDRGPCCPWRHWAPHLRRHLHRSLPPPLQQQLPSPSQPDREPTHKTKSEAPRNVQHPNETHTTPTPPAKRNTHTQQHNNNNNNTSHAGPPRQGQVDSPAVLVAAPSLGPSFTAVAAAREGASCSSKAASGRASTMSNRRRAAAMADVTVATSEAAWQGTPAKARRCHSGRSS